ncbi:MAG: VOC family protein [Deinococcus-Thermus bacterium]|jgi:hypothetical protein|nr:VOC family protein [Deinococcota bacterium]
MTATFDHLVIAAEDLASGAAEIEAALGVPLVEGGRHGAFGTHNRLLGLGPGEYLEVIAVDPGAPRPGRARWFGLDRFDGATRPVAWVVRVPELDRADAPGAPVDLERGAYRWRMAVPADGTLPNHGLHPAVIEWQGCHPADDLPESGCRLASLVLSHPEPHAISALPGADDPRVSVRAAEAPRLAALVETPHGAVWL